MKGLSRANTASGTIPVTELAGQEHRDAQSQRQQGRLDYMVEQPALDQYEGVEKVLEHVALSPGSLPGPGQGGETEAPRCEAAEQVVECRRKGVLA